MFPNKCRKTFVAETMFPILLTCFQMFPAQEPLVFPFRHVKTMFQDYNANINNTLILLWELIFPKNVSKFDYTEKHDRKQCFRNSVS